jgi:RHS repeat-associated protein
LDGNLAATIDQAGAITWQVTNAHGDVVATAPDGAAAPTDYYLTDEFGLDISGWTSPDRYGWLGGKQRPADTPGGLVLMGVRLYTPTLGRFLSTDPVPGGNENAYNYPNNPVNMFDLDGRAWYNVKKHWRRYATGAAFATCVVASAGACFMAGAAVAGANYAADRRNHVPDAGEKFRHSMYWNIGGYAAGMGLGKLLGRSARSYVRLRGTAFSRSRHGIGLVGKRGFKAAPIRWSRTVRDMGLNAALFVDSNGFGTWHWRRR